MENLYTIKEAMEYLKVSRGTIYNLIKSKELIPVKIGSSVRFKKSNLEKLVRD